MKFFTNSFRAALKPRIAAAAGLSLALGLGTVACSRDYVAAYVYTSSTQTGSVSGFAVDYQSGQLTQLTGSPFGSNLSNPVTLVAAPNNKFLYLIGGSINSQVEAFGIGTDGKLYGLNGGTVSLGGGTYPTAAAIDSVGKFLYVTFTYQVGFTPLSKGPGGVAIFPIKSDGSLGTPTSVNVGNNPVAVAVSAPTCSLPASAAAGSATGLNCIIFNSGSSSNNGTENAFVYVVDQEGSSYSPGAQPTVVGFVQNVTTGGLTLVPKITYNATLRTYQGINAGVTPSAIAIEPTGRYVYVTDATSNQIIGYSIGLLPTAVSGNLTALNASPFATGLRPVAITIEPRGKYAYVVNTNSATVSSYSINSPDGSLGGSASVGSFSTSTGPTCVTVDPAVGIFLYTSNYLDGTISGGQLSPNTGQLNAVANTPFPTFTFPSCIVSVANGAHASQFVNP